MWWPNFYEKKEVEEKRKRKYIRKINLFIYLCNYAMNLNKKFMLSYILARAMCWIIIVYHVFLCKKKKKKKLFVTKPMY